MDCGICKYAICTENKWRHLDTERDACDSRACKSRAGVDRLAASLHIISHSSLRPPAHVSSLSSSPSRPTGGTSLIAHASNPRPRPCRGTHVRAFALAVPRAVARPACGLKKCAIGWGPDSVEYP